MVYDFYILLIFAVDKPLTGMKFLTIGKLTKNKDELKVAIEDLGGKITSTVNKASLCLSTKSKHSV